MIDQQTLNRTVSLRSLSERLSSVLDLVLSEPGKAKGPARELLADLHEILPRESIAELNDAERQELVGTLVEIQDEDTLGLLVAVNGRRAVVSVLSTKWPYELTEYTWDMVYARWEIPGIFPLSGVSVASSYFEHTKTRFVEHSDDVEYEDVAAPAEEVAEEIEPAAEPEGHPEEPEEKPAPSSVPKYAEITEAEFYELPKDSRVRAVNFPGQEVTGLRTRKGRWHLSSYGRSMSDAEAWEKLVEHGYKDRVFLCLADNED